MKTALITGVSGGIGLATAEKFAAAGWRVVGTDRVEPNRPMPLATFLRGDVSRVEFWETDVLGAVDASDGVDVLVNNAAVQVCRPLVEMPPSEWDEVMGHNLRAVFLAIRTLAPLMSGRDAAIVNVSSVHAMATSRAMGAYAASKGAMVALTRSAAIELAPDGIRVNCVVPGAVDTQMLRAGASNRGGTESEDDKLRALAAVTPLKRVGEPRDVAEGIYFLACHESSAFVTGQSLVIDGGALSCLSTELKS